MILTSWLWTPTVAMSVYVAQNLFYHAHEKMSTAFFENSYEACIPHFSCFDREEKTMSGRELFNCYYEAWKIISDYIEWVTGGGESLYGSVEVARNWAGALLAAQSSCF